MVRTRAARAANKASHRCGAPPQARGSAGLLRRAGAAQNAAVTRPDSAAAAPTLQDFEPLLLAEAVLLRAAAQGNIAKVGYQRPRTPAPDVRLRAEFLAFLARGGGPGAPVKGRRLQLLGACIVGHLDLRDSTLRNSLWFYRCVFGAPLELDGAHLHGSLTFRDCALPGFSAEGARIDGELEFDAGCNMYGELTLTSATIGRHLSAERLHLRSSSKFPHTRPCRVLAENLRVGEDVLLAGGVETVGELRFRGAKIRGDLRASGLHARTELDESGTRGVALNLDGADVRGSVFLDAGFSATGQVRMQRVRIAGDLNCRGAEFDALGDAGWGDTGAVLLDRARIGGALVLRELQSPLSGASLVDARAGSLLDDAATWGDHYALDGFVYKRLAAEAPTDPAMRVDWLGRQVSGTPGGDPLPDPWRRLIKVLRRMGRDGSAGDVAIGRERHLRRAGLIGRDAPQPLRWLPRLGHDLFGMLAGYGHRPLRLLAITLALWLAWFWSTHGAPVLDTSVPGLWRTLTWIEALCGGTATLMLIACVTGLTDRDRRR